MLDLRKRIFIILSLGIGFILAFTLLFYFVLNKKKAVEVAAPLTGETTAEATAALPGGSSAPAGGGAVLPPAKEPEVFVPVEKSREIYAKQIARLFVERFTTFSNQNDNTHIDDVLILATSPMGKWIETQKIKTAAEYQGVTTKVIAASLSNISDNSASVKVDTQQIKSNADKQETAYRSGTVDLVDAGGEWKVGGFYWDTN
ncbi:MAG: hypothetical protein A2921_03220 [Candidatus Magasanikbacteria bacterium RIFCSPLOWO2_01_FULL_43_20b]|nr:MAG: hypothetical protein A2921_03220 [Candidatus Magasanikbacteria bacterium RIFCSPLOWO2_01_FULL_43_20b]